jgi:hypothetical protein
MRTAQQTGYRICAVSIHSGLAITKSLLRKFPDDQARSDIIAGDYASLLKSLRRDELKCRPESAVEGSGELVLGVFLAMVATIYVALGSRMLVDQRRN